MLAPVREHAAGEALGKEDAGRLAATSWRGAGAAGRGEMPVRPGAGAAARGELRNIEAGCQSEISRRIAAYWIGVGDD